MNRISLKLQELKARKKLGLFPFLTVGYPDVESTLRLVPALVEAGADLVELGVPFSDPLADGATIQRASFAALKQGVNLRTCFQVARELRASSIEVPLVLMGYYNTIYRWGIEPFAQQAAEAGIDGVIVADLPPEEAAPLNEALMKQGLDLIFLLAPTSSEERIRKVSAIAKGFIYCVSLRGVTGARQRLAPGLAEFVSRVKRETALPVAVGFGISSSSQVRAVGEYSDAVIIGSALIDVLDKTPSTRRVQEVKRFIAKMRA